MNLLIGFHGLLGAWSKLEGDRATKQELDITQEIIPNPKYDLIVLAAAYTNVMLAEIEKGSCFETNVTGVMNVLLAYPKTPIVYISTEYAKNPVNFYSLTKSLAEQLVTTHSPYLIIRTLFKPFPYPYDVAFTDQYTQGDTVNIIAPLIDKAIREWDRKTNKLIYVGTGRKTMFELAQKSRPDVKPNSINDMSVKLPKDYA